MSPEQAAYEASAQPGTEVEPWGKLSPAVHEKWKRIAQAVIDAHYDSLTTMHEDITRPHELG